jgi:hypothetical protein
VLHHCACAALFVPCVAPPSSCFACCPDVADAAAQLPSQQNPTAAAVLLHTKPR